MEKPYDRLRVPLPKTLSGDLEIYESCTSGDAKTARGKEELEDVVEVKVCASPFQS